MVAVGTIFYNDKTGIERLLESCWKNVDLMFMIDGRFRDYPIKEKLSTDGSREIIAKYPNAVLVNAPNLQEYQKRQIYLDLCKKYNMEYLVIVDSDEYINPTSDWDEFKTERKKILNLGKDYIYNLKNYTSSEIGLLPIDQPRLWRDPGKLEYKSQRHYQWGLRHGISVMTAKYTLYSISLCHDPSFRSEERTEEHNKYIKQLEKYEKKKQRTETKIERNNRNKSVWGGN